MPQIVMKIEYIVNRHNEFETKTKKNATTHWTSFLSIYKMWRQKKISDLTQYCDIFRSAFSGISIFDAI